MNQKNSFQQMIPIMLIFMLLGVLVVVVLGLSNTPPAQLALDVSYGQSGDTRSETFDYERAAEINAMRWQAMATYYKKHGLLTRDDFDYERAAEINAMRWQAMATYYKEHGLLTRDDFDYEAAANNSAYRWQAMARFYEKHDLLNK